MLCAKADTVQKRFLPEIQDHELTTLRQVDASAGCRGLLACSSIMSDGGAKCSTLEWQYFKLLNIDSTLRLIYGHSRLHSTPSLLSCSDIHVLHVPTTPKKQFYIIQHLSLGICICSSCIPHNLKFPLNMTELQALIHVAYTTRIWA